MDGGVFLMIRPFKKNRVTFCVLYDPPVSLFFSPSVFVQTYLSMTNIASVNCKGSEAISQIKMTEQ